MPARTIDRNAIRLDEDWEGKQRGVYVPALQDSLPGERASPRGTANLSKSQMRQIHWLDKRR